MEGKRDFHNLLELIMCRENLIHAIRKVKSNTGFRTSGVDKQIGQQFLQEDAEVIFNKIHEKLLNYQPNEVKRVYIRKANGKQRPLGIPTIVDRIIQTAIANIIEPILEASMYEHSYGFRPMRSIEHAVAYLSALTTQNQRHFVLEGDIKGYFDNIDHNTLLNKLFKYGIRDKRVIMIIKKILKAGIQGEKDINDIGTPQGGTISTLLSNVYLNDFDHWIDGQWRKFNSQNSYAYQQGKVRMLKTTNLKQGYLIRYADDWIIVTDSYENATKWKHACKKYLNQKLKLELSEEKTLITDLREDKMNFLGITFFKEKGVNNNYTLRSYPQEDKLKAKMEKVYGALKEIRKSNNNAELVENIVNYNSIIRGIREFYKITTLCNLVLSKLEWQMSGAFESTKNRKVGKRINISQCNNNICKYNANRVKTTTIAFHIEGNWIGLERLDYITFTKPRIKAQWMNPYSLAGREKYEQITGHKWTTFCRNPQLTLGNISCLLAKNTKDSIYNLEYFINRPMAFNRDKCKCRICKKPLTGAGDTEIHHLDKSLPKDKINKLPNLITTCCDCHLELHGKTSRKKTNKVANKDAKGTKPKQVQQSKCPPKEILLQEIQESSYVQIGKKYGVSDNAVKKWAIKYDIHDLRKNKLIPRA